MSSSSNSNNNNTRSNRRRSSGSGRNRSNVPRFDQSNDNLDTIAQLEQLRLSANASDEILGEMNPDSFRSTPHPSRQQTPLSETDPGTEVEVRAEDLGVYDIQGVNWSNYAVSREDYRSIRMREYQEFENARRVNDNNSATTLPSYPEEVDDPDRIRHCSPLGPLLAFRYMNKADTCHVPHFQLRHLLCCPTVRTVLFPHFQRIKSWNPVTNVSEVILNTGEFGTAFTKTSVIAATKDHVFVGGFSGELVVKRLDADSVPARLKSYSADPNCITNHMFPFEDADGMGAKLLISSNDCTLRLYDVRENRMRSLARFPYALNASEPQPLSHSGGSSSSSRLIACVGDSRKVRLLDGQSLAEVAALPAHDDFAFSCSWSPCGRFLASGSQDCTAKIFDVRQLNRPLHTFTAQMAPIRRVCFSPCGRFLAVMEADDFVHVYSTQRAYREGQIIDFFGECSGIAWDPQGDSLYIGCSGAENGGIMEFRVSECA